MRASELLGRPVRTSAGRSLGVVHDLRLRRQGGDLQVAALVVGPDNFRMRASHVSGMAQGRTTGPALLRAFLTPRPAPLRIDAREVLAWSDGNGVVVDETADLVGGGE